jgi:hypothetical protein
LELVALDVTVRVLIKIFWEIRVQSNVFLACLVSVELQGDYLGLVQEHCVLRDSLDVWRFDLCVIFEILHLLAEIDQNIRVFYLIRLLGFLRSLDLLRLILESDLASTSWLYN